MAIEMLRASRREVLLSLGTTATAALLSTRASQAAGQTQAGPALLSGRVLDASAHERDRGAAGIPNVMVSNGCDVALTGADGSWTLPARGDGRVFVVKPAHWSYATRSGVPDFWLSSAGGQTTGFDFFLRKQIEPARFSAVLVADSQAANAQELEYVRSDLARGLAGVDAAFALHHGDAMGDQLSLLPAYRDLVAQTGLVWHHCPGNHDMDLSSPGAHGAFETWRRVMGPTHYAFQYAGATFIVLNNVEYLGHGASAPDGRIYRGHIGAEQLAFVANVLKHVGKDQLVVVSMHIPLVSFENPGSAADTTADRQALMALLSEFPYTVSFAGHSHTTEHHYLGRDDQFVRETPHHHHVLTALCGSWWSGPPDERGIPRSDSRDGSPRGFHVLNVDGERYVTEFHPLSVDAQARASVRKNQILVTTGGEGRSADNVHLLVDVFDGGPRTSVVCELPGGTCVSLARTPRTDPYIVDSYADHKPLLKPWVVASPSSHIWTASLAAFPQPAQECVIRVRSEYGDEQLLRLTI